MNVATFTNVVISKGLEDNPAIRIITKDSGTSAFFRVGERVYDKRAKDNYRWNNWDVKVFGSYLVERIQNMKLDAGSYVNLSGRMDISSWEDNGEKRISYALILNDVEFCHGNNGNGQNNGNNQNNGNGQNNGNNQNNRSVPESTPSAPAQSNIPQASPQQGAPQTAPYPQQTGMPENFTGYEQFSGGTNPFYPQS